MKDGITTEEQLQQIVPGATWPAPPEGLGAFTSAEVTVTQDAQMVTRLPPAMPQRIEVSWEDDDMRHERERTDEEMAAAVAAYNANAADFAKNGGVSYVAGQRTTEGTFRNGQGDAVKGIWHAGEWIWRETWKQ